MKWIWQPVVMLSISVSIYLPPVLSPALPLFSLFPLIFSLPFKLDTLAQTEKASVLPGKGWNWITNYASFVKKSRNSANVTECETYQRMKAIWYIHQKLNQCSRIHKGDDKAFFYSDEVRNLSWVVTTVSWQQAWSGSSQKGVRPVHTGSMQLCVVERKAETFLLSSSQFPAFQESLGKVPGKAAAGGPKWFSLIGCTMNTVLKLSQ